MIRNYEIIFAKTLHGRPLRPYLWSRLVTTAKTTFSKVKRALEHVNLNFFYDFHVLYSPSFLIPRLFLLKINRDVH